MIINPSRAANSVKEYYFSKKLAEINMIKKNGTEVINLGIGNPDLSPDKKVIQALNNSSDNLNEHGYQTYKGSDELRTAFSDWYKKHFNVSLNPTNEILPLLGSKAGIMHISLAFLNNDDVALVPNPAYPVHFNGVIMAGGILHNIPTSEENDFLPDLDSIPEEILNQIED